MISIPEQPDFSVGENNVLALDCGQLQSQISHLRLHLPLLLPGLHLLTLDIQQHLLLAQLLEQVAELRLDAGGHGIVDGGDQSQDISSSVADHVSGEGSPGPELLISPVDILHLLLHRVDRSSVQLTQSIERHILDFVNRFSSVLQLKHGMGSLEEQLHF